MADDYRLYSRLVAAAARRAGTAVWAYCVMPNHVHLIMTPADADALWGTFAEAHRRYAGAINARFCWTDHLFQGCFGAVVMDERICWRRPVTSRSIPVFAGLVTGAEDRTWSSTRAQLAGGDNELTMAARLRALIPDFAALLAMPIDAATTRIERAAIGRPLERPEWIAIARLQARPPFGTPQTRPKAASGARHRTASAAAVKRRANCQCIPIRFKVSVSPITTRPAQGEDLIPKRRSL